ncbi:hypothetical protein FM038_007425 [Shewanella eurypsychrophilus]|uniref:Uncharacterized protein n=1 Tax=Shewanella eurypsychrophilus TaxID=2593656 RepID=A0ABX6V3Q9_9GAMM|nr:MULTISPECIES: hypothetical protein [Shewanella]QFU21996.1 hypothetical protein FS418_09005 [Shewanella sp. YLB-09]QPG57285.1 hypothetical protein FM038_007425 [Shewanella eurypsychrophilus]
MNAKILLPIALLTLSGSALAGDMADATTTLHWKGIVPTVVPGEAVIITGPSGRIPYIDSAGLDVKDTTGVFTSDQISLELHYRMCSDGSTSDGSCGEAGYMEGEVAEAVGDLIPDADWTMTSLETVIGTLDTTGVGTVVKMEGTKMDKSIPVTATTGTVTFTTENAESVETSMGAELKPGQNIEVHTVINSAKAI